MIYFIIIIIIIIFLLLLIFVLNSYLKRLKKLNWENTIKCPKYISKYVQYGLYKPKWCWSDILYFIIKIVPIVFEILTTLQKRIAVEIFLVLVVEVVYRLF